MNIGYFAIFFQVLAMAAVTKTVEDLSASNVLSPKFVIGHEFIVPSSFFGRNWAKSKFKKKFNVTYLIGRVKKSRVMKGKKVEYTVGFKYDKVNYVFSEELVLGQLPVKADFEKAICSDGTVEIFEVDFKKWRHGQCGKNSRYFLNFFTTTNF